MYFLLKIVVFHCYVRLPEGTFFGHDLEPAMVWSRRGLRSFLATTHAVKAADYWRAEFNVKEEPMTVSWEFLNLPCDFRLHKTRPLINSVVLNVFCLTSVDVIIRKCHMKTL